MESCLDADDVEEVQNDAVEVSTVQDLYRAQAVVFDDWVRNVLPRIQDVQSRHRYHSTQSTQSHCNTIDETRSIKELIGEAEDKRIIDSPRDYQLELFERAKTQNLIAVLDTGSGKTLIAILLLRWTMDQELERRATGTSRKICCFLTHSINLAMQQHAVLCSNLPHSILLLYGDLNVDAWTQQEWYEALQSTDIVVCTAEILYQALGRARITMSQISLLIFDEAHHAKKNHSYARIVREFYTDDANRNARPRIFGMTASPVDGNAQVGDAAGALEGLLQSQIITTGTMTSLQSNKHAEEKIVLYLPSQNNTYNSELVEVLRAQFGHLSHLANILEKAKAIALHLGEWCADQYLLELTSFNRRQAMSDEVGVSSSSDILQNEYATMFDWLDAAWHLRGAITERGITNKTRALIRQIQKQFATSDDNRCLVFVEEKLTAYLLSVLFKQMELPNVRCNYLTGTGEPFSDQAKATLREQTITLLKFRKGEYNCLFTTSVAEEGLDIPDCNLIIRFDLYKSMIGFIQSRGRARKHGSLFIHMQEKGNSTHDELTKSVRKHELQMRHFCNSLPANRRLLSDDDQDLVLLERTQRSYVEPETGAKLTEHNALGFLSSFVAAIPTDRDEPQQPAYHITSSGLQYRAEVVLPAGAPLSSVLGQPCARKILAKCSAAFEACLLLRGSGHIDGHFKPTYDRRRQVKQTHLLAEGLNKQDKYSMSTKPLIWQQTRGSVPTELWCTIFTFNNASSVPLMLLTRTAMPQIPEIPIFRQAGELVRITSNADPMPSEYSREQISKLCKFTLLIFQDVFSKTYDNTAEDMSYFLAPVCQMTDQDVPHIDWSIIGYALANMQQKWMSGTAVDSLIGRVLLDPFDGGRKFVVHSVNKSLSATHALPADSIKCAVNTTILDASYSMRSKARDVTQFSEDQPVLDAELLSQRRNLLVPPTQQELTTRTKAYICPEPMVISSLSAGFVHTCLTWPSIIWRLESVLITQEACAMLDLRCDAKLALAAFTKDRDESVDHGNVDLINFRQGMGENYERLEFLGDTFLKMATTISVYVRNLEDNEENLHVKRMFMLCNQNLFEVATELQTFKYIRTLPFHRRFWYPEGMRLIKGKGAGTAADKADVYQKMTHDLSVKTIADVSEAVIGAAYLTHSDTRAWTSQTWDQAVLAVTKLVKSKDHDMLGWAGYAAAYSIPAYYTRRANASERHMVEQVKSSFDYTFKSPTLLRSAFLHPSQPRSLEQLPSYERLEFLGDALLDMAIIDHIFHRYPTHDEQWMTETKTVMAGNRFLGALACNLGFHKMLRHNSAILQAQITSYVTELEEAKATAGESRCYWLKIGEPPKCLADIVESYVGAMFLDSGFDFGFVLHFFNKNFGWYFEDMSIYAEYTRSNPALVLSHKLQALGCHGLRTLIKERPGLERANRRELVVGVMIHNHVIAHSTGISSRYASGRAAKEALAVLDKIHTREFRQKFSCTCGAAAMLDGSVADTSLLLP